jgi:hypothetical protein
MKLLFLFSAIILFNSSCKRKVVTKVSTDFIGNWVHDSSDGSTSEFLEINKNGRGYIDIYEENESVGGDQSRKWFIKNDRLLFGRLSGEAFEIDLYPTVSEQLIIDGLDTIRIDDMYMILDGNYYLKY